MIDTSVFQTLSQPLEADADIPASIDYNRSAIYAYDKDIFKNKGDFHNNSGLCRKTINKTVFSCLYIKGSNKSLHVGFSGAKRQDHNYLLNPGISRWSYHRLYNGCFLGIDDPMYYKYKNLNLGWYYGNKESFYVQDSLQIVDHVLSVNDIDCRDVTFFSSSGGGYAALMASLYYPGSLSISLNPQIYIGNWNYSSQFSKITGIDLSKVDKFHRNDPIPLIRTSKSRHVILFNASSDEDTEKQLKPLLQYLGINIRYGLNRYGNLLIWLYDSPGAPDGHTSFETKSIYIAIDNIANKFKNETNFDMEHYQKQALLINEIWHDLYQAKKETYELKCESEAAMKNCLNEILNIKSRGRDDRNSA